jgi:hypothetical protein
MGTGEIVGIALGAVVGGVAIAVVVALTLKYATLRHEQQFRAKMINADAVSLQATYKSF